MAPNMEFIKKADQQISDFAAGGKVPDEKLAEFIKIAIKQSDLLQRFSTRTFKGTEFELSKIGFENRVLRPGGERVVLSEADRAVATPSKVVLKPESFKAEYSMSYEVLEDNIEQNTFMQTVQEELAKAVARDLVDVVLNGDTAGTGDSTLKVLNGIFKQSTTHAFDAGGARYGKSVMEAMLRALPSQFADKSKLMFICSHNGELDYGFSIASRQTSAGDQALTETVRPRFLGMPVLGDPMVPENLGGSTDRSVAILLDPKKVHLGWKREMTLEVVKDPRAGEYIIVARMRVDVKLEHEQATVKATNILAG